MQIRAGIRGTVFKVLVASGDVVAAGDEVMVLESMKMEIPVQVERGGRGGRGGAVLVREGGSVTEDQAVLELDVA